MEKGETAAQLLLNVIAGDGHSAPKIVLPTELIVRESVSLFESAGHNKGGEADHANED